MRLANTYQAFIEHTGLVDSVYKSVFMQISGFMDRIDKVSFQSFTYTTDGKKFFWDFTEGSKVPLYVTEMIRNLFENSYSLPNNCSLSLAYSYDNKACVITSDMADYGELEFIRTYKLCPYFFSEKGIYDPISAFDELFMFMNIMCHEKTMLIPELQDIFRGAKEASDMAMEEKETIDELHRQIEHLKGKCKTLQQENELHQIKLMTVQDYISESKVASDKIAELQQRLDNTITEYEQAYLRYTEISESYAKTVETITKLDIILSSDRGEYSDEDLRFYAEKKNTLQSYADKVRLSEQRLKNQLSYLKVNRDALQKEISDLGAASIVNKVAANGKSFTELQEVITRNESLVVSYQAQIHQLNDKIALIDREDPAKKAITDIDTFMGKLFSLGYSKPVAVVINYLRNLFVYKVMLSTELLEKQHVYKNYGPYEIPISQLVCVRKELKALFNLNIKPHFSIVSIDSNTISIVKDEQ